LNFLDTFCFKTKSFDLLLLKEETTKLKASRKDSAKFASLNLAEGKFLIFNPHNTLQC